MKKEQIGKCESCRFAKWTAYDPSPAGISLGGGYMWDFECEKWESEEWDKIFEIYGDKIDDNIIGDKIQCPLWEPFKYIWCDKHRIWHKENELCTYCEEQGWGEEEILWEEANNYKNKNL